MEFEKQSPEGNGKSYIVEKKNDHKICKSIFKVFSFIGATLTFIRNFISNAVMLLLLLVVYMAIQFADDVSTATQEFMQTNTKDIAKTKSPLLHLNLKGFISEIPFSNGELDIIKRQLNQNITGVAPHSIDRIEKALLNAKDDDYIKEALVDLSGLNNISLAMAKRIGKALESFKSSDKKVTVFANTYSQTNYLIASYADEIVMDPLGQINLTGVGLNSLYYKGLLERFKITPYIFRAGEFKSAVEPFIRQDMSESVKEEYQNLADSIWQDYLSELKSRPQASVVIKKLLSDTENYLSLLKKNKGDLAQLQLNLKLVDKLLPKEKLLSSFAQVYGLKKDSVYAPISYDYEDYLNANPPLNEKTDKNKVAFVYGVGEIVDDNKGPETFCPDNIVPLLDKVAKDDTILGLVFYINSGGGSVTASEKIRNALLRVKESGKKVVVSFNSMGASGAYWIASAADKIIATKETLTGSIGVFGMSFGVSELLNEYGITEDGVVTSDMANRYIAKPLSENAKEFFSLSVKN